MVALADYDFARCAECINSSRIALEYPRQKREQLVRATVGPGHSDETSTDMTRSVNLLDLFTKVVVPNLIAQNPRVLLSTWDNESKPAVRAMQEVLNQDMERLEFAETAQRCGLDSLYTLGIGYVGIATPADAKGSSWKAQAGQVFIDVVDFDDFFYDTHARRFSQAAFIGNFLRLPLKAVKADPSYGPRRHKLLPSEDRKYNAQGDQRISVIGRSQRVGVTEEAEDMVELANVFLPRERVMVTFEVDGAGRCVVDPDGRPLKCVPYIGPPIPCGPYHLLGMGVSPGNAMPKAPIPNLETLDHTINMLVNKLIRQALDQKTVVGVAGEEDADGNRIIDANDGQIIKLNDPKAIATLHFNGPDQMVFQLAEALKQIFSYMAGNMDSFGGLAAMAKTASQDRMMAENSSRMIQDMQARMLAWVVKVLKAVAWYEWEHPFNVRSYEHKLPGSRRGFMRKVYPRESARKYRKRRRMMSAGMMPKDGKVNLRQLPFDQLDLRVDPFSIQAQTPQTRLASMNGVVTQIVIPMMTILAQQGVSFDANAYLKKVGEYLDLPDLAEILTIQQPIQPEGSSAGPSAPKEDKVYQRENVSVRSEKGASQQLMAKLQGVKTGGNPQVQE